VIKSEPLVGGQPWNIAEDDNEPFLL